MSLDLSETLPTEPDGWALLAPNATGVRRSCASCAVLAYGAMLLFVVEFLSRSSGATVPDAIRWGSAYLSHISKWFINSPSQAAANLALIIAVLTLSIGFAGQRMIGLTVGTATVLALVEVSRTKYAMLYEPLVWLDLTLLRETLPVLREFVSQGVVVAALTALLLILICLRVELQRSGGWISWRQRVGLVLLGLAIPFGVVACHGTYVGSWLGEPDLRETTQCYSDAISQYYKHNGFLLFFAFTVRSNQWLIPPNYSADRVRALIPPAPPTSVARFPTQPHVVILMSESLWDVTQLPGVRFSPDPLVHYRSLGGNVSRFQILSPVFGKGTANVEFELLTGLSTRFLPTGTTPYIHLMTRPVPSLPRLFAAHGYRTLAVHPYQREFWQRNRVYPLLGFDRFEAEETFDPARREGNYLSDRALTERIVQRIDEADQPLFLFAVSMQNHAPYHPKTYAGTTTQVEHAVAGLDGESLQTLAQGVADADRAMALLVEHFSRRKGSRPVVFMFFGDHLPPLGQVYDPTGFRDEKRQDDPYQRIAMRATPGLLWTDGPFLLPKFNGPVSPSMVVPALLGSLGIDHPFFTRFLGEGLQHTPGFSRYVCVDALGTPMLSPPPAAREFEATYELIQYDMLLGERLCAERFSPEK